MEGANADAGAGLVVEVRQAGTFWCGGSCLPLSFVNFGSAPTKISLARFGGKPQLIQLLLSSSKLKHVRWMPGGKIVCLDARVGSEKRHHGDLD